MIRRTLALVRRALSGHTTVAAYLALLLASSTAAYAAATIGSAEVINNSLQSVDLKDGAAVGGIDVINDSLKGADIDEASLSGVGRKLLFSVNTATGKTNIGTVAGYTFKATCIFNGTGGVFVQMLVNGPAGDYQAFTAHRINDAGAFTNESGGAAIPASTDRPMFTLGVDPSSFRRATSQAWIHSGATVLQLDVHLLVDNRNTGACTIYGMVTRGV